MRFVRESNLAAVETVFTMKIVSAIPVLRDPNYNSAPQQIIPGVVMDNLGERSVRLFRWGLVPSWAKDESFGSKLLNARGETLSEKPSFRDAFRKRRCLIIADGYYEWIRSGDTKQPVYIYLSTREPFGIAGLWESWISPEGSAVDTCTIVTIHSNELIRPFHHRMPVIIPREHHDLWLDPSRQDTRELQPLIQPFPAGLMHYHKVSTRVNSPKYNSPDCILPIEG
ncbi:SOS response-associated peptidase [candidate division KSB1 bacterium]